MSDLLNLDGRTFLLNDEDPTHRAIGALARERAGVAELLRQRSISLQMNAVRVEEYAAAVASGEAPGNQPVWNHDAAQVEEYLIRLSQLGSSLGMLMNVAQLRSEEDLNVALEAKMKVDPEFAALVGAEGMARATGSVGSTYDDGKGNVVTWNRGDATSRDILAALPQATFRELVLAELVSR